MESRRGNIKAVLFDFDCTLVDSTELICRCFNSVLTRFGFETLQSDSIRAMIGQPLREMLEQQHIDVPLDDLVAAYKEAFASNSPDGSFLLPGADEVIPELAAGCNLAIVTTRTAAGALEILKRFGLSRFFSTVVGIENVTLTKPDPEPVRLALERLKVPALQAVFVGDTIHDMAAARSAGTGAIGITTGPHGREQLLAAGADFVLQELRKLPGALQEYSSTV